MLFIFTFLHLVARNDAFIIFYNNNVCNYNMFLINITESETFVHFIIKQHRSCKLFETFAIKLEKCHLSQHCY